MALFVGNEGKGISPALRGALDQLVAIPMGASIDSFSVNAATAVILYVMTHSATGEPPRSTNSSYLTGEQKP
jgi:tRNA G18 (ribose-2'-O)-methylase SpoU